MHETERLAVVGIEMEAAGLEAVGDRDSPDGAAGLGKMIGNSDRLKHPHRA